MRLLICTQKVDRDDPVLGFFHRWIEELSQKCEHVLVVCLEKGTYSFSGSVTVLSLGKEVRIVSRLRYALRFLQALFFGGLDYDSVFVHMNPEYVVLAGWWWRLTGRRVVLWYSHRHADIKLRVAAYFATSIASSAPSSFRLKTLGVHFLGHGIDTDVFVPHARRQASQWELLSPGRITPIKRLEVAIDALGLLRSRGIDARLRIVGTAVSKTDKIYEQNLKERVANKSLETYVIFQGPVAYSKMPPLYTQCDVCLNLAPTGGLDKAALEAMSCAVPTFLCNQGFTEYLGQYRDRLEFRDGDPVDLAEKLIAMHAATDTALVGAHLRSSVIARAGLRSLVGNLLMLLSENR